MNALRTSIAGEHVRFECIKVKYVKLQTLAHHTEMYITTANNKENSLNSTARQGDEMYGFTDRYSGYME